MYKQISSFYTLFLISTVTLSTLGTKLSAQNIYEIYVNSYANARELKKVKFNLYQNNMKLIEQVSNDGTFNFVIMQGDADYKLIMTIEGYIKKVMHFKTKTYPFLNEYEIQEIDLEFHEYTSPDDKEEVGELRWNEVGQLFNAVKMDEDLEYAKSHYASSGKVLDDVYLHSIKNGDELMSLRLPKFAKAHFEAALLAKPNDAYATRALQFIANIPENKPVQNKIDKAMMDKINRGEINNVPASKHTDGIIYSVQLGAFSKAVSASKFVGVPDFKMIQYEDFTRCFSGDFIDINLAIIRKNEMVQKGYKDAWIVQMKGNKRLGF